MRGPALVALVGCGSAPSPTAAPIGNSNVAPKQPSLVLRMERTTCLGACPAYTVSIMSDGIVTWHGRSSVAAIGARTTQVTLADVDRLIAAFDHAGFFRLDDKEAKFRIEKVNGRDVTVICDALDAPSTIVSIPHAGTLHRYNHQGGCNDELDSAEQLVDTIVGTQRWIAP